MFTVETGGDFLLTQMKIKIFIKCMYYLKIVLCVLKKKKAWLPLENTCKTGLEVIVPEWPAQPHWPGCNICFCWLKRATVGTHVWGLYAQNSSFYPNNELIVKVPTCFSYIILLSLYFDFILLYYILLYF